MIDEDRTKWTLGQLADEVIEACELPPGCRGTLIAALHDAKLQGRAESAKQPPFQETFGGTMNELDALRAEVRRHRRRWESLESMLRACPGCVVADIPRGVRIEFASGQRADCDSLPEAVDAANRWPPLGSPLADPGHDVSSEDSSNA